MQNLTQKETKEINGGTTLPILLGETVTMILEQLDAIENLGNLTGTSSDLHKK